MAWRPHLLLRRPHLLQLLSRYQTAPSSHRLTPFIQLLLLVRKQRFPFDIQMSMTKGIVFNPEALELFVLNKVFIVHAWLKQHGIPKPELKTGNMARMLGFGIGEELFNLIEKHPVNLS